MKPRIIILLNSIDVNKGGLTHASLRQASTFADAGYDTQILTFHYEPRFPIICKKLKEMGKVSEKVVIRNMFEELALYNDKDRTTMLIDFTTMGYMKNISLFGMMTLSIL